MFQPHLPVRLPCYDLAPITSFALGRSLRSRTLGALGGEGRYGERGKKPRVLKKGDVVRIAPDVEHWHGAAPDSWFVHISVETNVPDNKAEWLEPVSEEEYGR